MPDLELEPHVDGAPRAADSLHRFHALVRDHEPEAKVYEAARTLTVMWALIAFRARGLHSENVPNGPVILAPNHASLMDHVFAGAFIRRRVQSMGAARRFKGIEGWVYSHGGVFPARDGQSDEEAFISALEILGRGGAVVMYCEGGVSRTGRLAEVARPEIGRLALESGAAIVPVAILGAHQVRNWKRLQFPKVIVEYGEPFRFELEPGPTRERQQQAADYIFARLRALHDRLLARRGEVEGGETGVQAARPPARDAPPPAQEPEPQDPPARERESQPTKETA